MAHRDRHRRGRAVPRRAAGGDVRTVRRGLRVLGSDSHGVRVSVGAEDVSRGRAGFGVHVGILAETDGGAQERVDDAPSNN